jgi:hypothetical protein
MRKLGWMAALLACTGCSDAFRAHPAVVARIDGHELSVERLAEIFVVGQPLPLRSDIVSELANHWIDMTALATRLASGDSLLDSAVVFETMWLEVRQHLIDRYKDQQLAADWELSETAVDSAFEAGELRMMAHVVRTVTASSTQEERLQQYQAAERILQGLVTNLTWREANEFNQDEVSKQANGSLGAVRRGETFPRFEKVAFALAPGELSAVTETPIGFHIIYRPLLEQVRESFTLFVRDAVAAQADSIRGAALLDSSEVEVLPSAPDAIRDAIMAPEDALGSARVLARYRGGEFTTGQFARWLQYLPGETHLEMMNAPDEEIVKFSEGLILQELLWNEVGNAGLVLGDSARTAIYERYRGGVAEIWQAARIEPDSLAAAAATAPEREREAARRVDEYFDAVAARRTPLAPVPPFLATQLRDTAHWEIVSAGVASVIERAGRLRAVTDTTGQ